MSTSNPLLAGLTASVLLLGCGSDPAGAEPGSADSKSAPEAAGGSDGTGGVAGSGGSGFASSGGYTGGAYTGSGGHTGGSTGGSIGSGGSASSGGSTGSGGSPGTGGSVGDKPPCVDDPTGVAIIGDSYVTGALSPALQPALGTLHPSASLFRNYAVPGTSLSSGGLAGFIGPQLDLALSAKTSLLIMDGGGNDILLCDAAKYPGCNTLCNRAGSASQQVCTDIVAAAMKTAEELLHRAAGAGVKDVIYFFYPHVPSSLGGFVDIIDYAEPLARAMCDGAASATGGRLRCHFVGLVETFIAAGGDMNPANFSIDGIHPSQAGQNLIAGEIWSTMQARCLGLPASSGCCTP